VKEKNKIDTKEMTKLNCGKEKFRAIPSFKSSPINIPKKKYHQNLTKLIGLSKSFSN
jgi:hypothetical protein